ncbi:Nitrilase-related protein [Sulfitobacter noctilucicola]|uniref:Putative amidohydrolase n=1 Tax=Sulfitobacter noctilucicola TaxID=1342301 RepID=A0A7W6M9U9_9RHOB|nr:nitrilase-related carbon-nitrogen hydrolase [Sulfitobacter noctilucicola]KIN63783.1 Nitrilase-related protein [Sulfitobacter noctilucicola]MBB4174708.1 putative amidohydrolase [Sulfitobacter noctilucicola]
MDTISIDLWAANLQNDIASLDSWIDSVAKRTASAAERGARILVLPEFACAQWLSFAPADLPASLHLEWLAGLTPTAITALKGISATYGVAILPGTFPVAGQSTTGSNGFFNRAFFLTPEGEEHVQDKMSLTPLEEQGEGGSTLHGTQINVISWQGLRIAMPICLDTEYTALWSRLGKLDLDLVLIAAKTDMITGYSRVFGCAHARAIELQTVVCVVGAVGAPLTPWETDTGVGGAAVFLPCDITVSEGGVWQTLPPQSAQDGLDIALHAASIPVGAVRAIRRGGAEAELRPASWTADHLLVSDQAAIAA